jgi:3'5'-cyclic nucleotide phosphodiesterase/GAF domain
VCNELVNIACEALDTNTAVIYTVDQPNSRLTSQVLSPSAYDMTTLSRPVTFSEMQTAQSNSRVASLNRAFSGRCTDIISIKVIDSEAGISQVSNTATECETKKSEYYNHDIIAAAELQRRQQNHDNSKCNGAVAATSAEVCISIPIHHQSSVIAILQCILPKNQTCFSSGHIGSEKRPSTYNQNGMLATPTAVSHSQHAQILQILVQYAESNIQRIHVGSLQQQSAATTKALFGILSASSSSAGMHAALLQLVQSVSDMLSARRVQLSLVDEISGEFRIKADSSTTAADTQHSAELAHDAQQVVASGKPVCRARNTHNVFPQQPPAPSDTMHHSYMTVPIKDTKGHTIAVIQAHDKVQPSPITGHELIISFSQTDVHRIELLSSHMSRLLAQFWLQLNSYSVESDETCHANAASAIVSSANRSPSSSAACDVKSAAASERKLYSFAAELLSQRVNLVQPHNWLQWNFNVWECTVAQLKQTVLYMFDYFSLRSEFNIPASTFSAFVDAVYNRYQVTNPYHNFHHGFSVMHCIFLVLIRTNLPCVLAPLHVLCLLISGLCHDIEHPGFNNAFAIKQQSSLALRYNDTSVLENHHAFVTFQLLRDPAFNVLASLTTDQFQRARTHIVQSILATDMQHHNRNLSDLDRLMEHMRSQNATAQHLLSQRHLVWSTSFVSDSDSENTHAIGLAAAVAGTPSRKVEAQCRYAAITGADSIQMLLNNVVHMADISNPMLPIQVSKKWSELVIREFNRQARLEKKFGMPVTTFMTASTPAACAKVTTGFIDFMVQPLWSKMHTLLPQLGVNIAYMNINRKYYGDIVLGKNQDASEKEALHATREFEMQLHVEK